MIYNIYIKKRAVFNCPFFLRYLYFKKLVFMGYCKKCRRTPKFILPLIILSLTLLHTDANALFCLNQDILTVKKGSDGTATSTL